MVKVTDTDSSVSSQFTQDNEMASQLVVPSESSSSNFSVVSQPPESNIIINGSLSSFNDMHFGLNSAIIDLPIEEMQLSIQHLLAENAELKSIVQQDHITMKSQFELMRNSEEQIKMFMKQQLERREQAKAVVEKLQAEIIELRKQKGCHDDSNANDKQIEELTNEIESLNKTLESKAEENEQQMILYRQIQMEVEELRSDCNQLKTGHTHLLAEKRELAAINATLQAKLTAVQSANDIFETGNGLCDGENQSFLVVQASSTSRKSLEHGNEKVEDSMIKNLLDQLSSEQLKSQALQAELEAEKAKVSAVALQIQGQEEVICRLAAMQQAASRQQEVKLMSELQASEEKVNAANSCIQDYQRRCDSLERHLSEYQNKLESFQIRDSTVLDEKMEEVQNLRRMLEIEKKQSAEYKKGLMDTEEKMKEFMQDYKLLKQSWDNFSQEQESKGRQSETYYCIQMKTLQEQVDSLTAKLVNREEALMAKEEELTTLKAEQSKLKAEVETIPILQAQVEVYKADFHAERESRERAKEEKERALEELRSLQATFSSHGLVKKSGLRHDSRRSCSASGPVPSAVPPATVGSAFTETSRFICPKCNREFKDYHPLLSHVNDCLDREDPFQFR